MRPNGPSARSRACNAAQATAVLLVAIGIFVPALSQAGQSSLHEACANVIAKSSEGIAACSRIIESGRLHGALLAAAYFNRGLGAAKNRNFANAIQDYNRAIELNPKNAHFVNARGYAYQRMGSKIRALADFNRAIEIDHTFAPALANRALIHLAAGETGKAIADTEAAVRADPKYAPAYRTRGIARFNDGHHKQALADINQALRLDPRDGVAYFHRGLLFQGMGKRKAGLADFRAALAIAPKHRDADIWRGKLKNFTRLVKRKARSLHTVPLPRPRPPAVPSRLSNRQIGPDF